MQPEWNVRIIEETTCWFAPTDPGVIRQHIKYILQEINLGWRRDEIRREDIDLLRVYAKAHRHSVFPACCKGMSLWHTDLEEAVREMHALVSDFLASDHRYHFLDAEANKKMTHCQIVFEQAIQRFGEPAQDYFARMLRIMARLRRLQFKMR